MGALLDLDVMAYVFAGIAVITGVLFRLVRLQLRHQRRAPVLARRLETSNRSREKPVESPTPDTLIGKPT